MSSPNEKFKVGISSCLYGNAVRYDGTDRFNASIIDRLQPVVEWVVVCPEADSGMGIPRETIQLKGDISSPRVITTHTQVDKTNQLKTYSQSQARHLAGHNISGFILKARSPSCGIKVNILLDDNQIAPNGQGIFVAALCKALPNLPMVSEEDLETDDGIEEFLAAMSRYRSSL